MRVASPAEQLLIDLGVEAPYEIDLEAIAWVQGASIEYLPLEGCEAQIIGLGNRATIVVNANSPPLRRRFSVGHELGHWHHHRGRSIDCRTVGESKPGPIGGDPERLADAYAADLLLPRYLLRHELTNVNRLDFAKLQAIAAEFEVSLTATALRLVQLDAAPAVLICHGVDGRKWFARAPSLPDEWFPHDELDPSSPSFKVVYGKQRSTRPTSVNASAWFKGRWARPYRVTEEAFKVSESDTLVLVGITDPNMVMSLEEPLGDGR